jgi:hypothetical protein
VATTGASAPALAEPGTYVPTEGASAALTAALGYYVSISGASEQTPAQPGTFVALRGATRAQLAIPGYYVPTMAASSAIAATPGHFVAFSGASAQTPASPGSYVVNSGASSATKAPPGTYVPTEGATTAQSAAPGYYVDRAGASEQIPAQPGTYVPTAGSTIAFMCPAGTTSYVASVACRMIAPGAAGAYVVGPELAWNAGVQLLKTNTTGMVEFEVLVENSSSDIGQADPLTTLTLLSADFDGWHADLFSISQSLPIILEEGQSTTLVVRATAPTLQPFTSILHLLTDEVASIGEPGITQQVEVVSFQVAANIDSDGDGLLDSEESSLNLRADKSDTDGDGLDDGFEVSAGSTDPLVDDSAMVQDIYNQRAEFGLYIPSDIQEGSVGRLMLEPQSGGPYRLFWELESTTNLEDGSWDPVSTNELWLTPEGSSDSMLFRIRIAAEGQRDGSEGSAGGTDPLVVQYMYDQRAEFGLYTPADIQAGAVGSLVLEPQGGGQYSLSWVLESTTNLVEGSWNPVSTNEVLFTPEGSLDTQLFRLQVGH